MDRFFTCTDSQSHKDKKTSEVSWRDWETDRRDGHFRRLSWSLPLLHNSTFQSGHWGVFCTQVVVSPAYPPGPPWGRTFLWKGRDIKNLKPHRRISVRLGRRVSNHQRIQICRLNKVKPILGNLIQDLTRRIMIFNFQLPRSAVQSLS